MKKVLVLLFIIQTCLFAGVTGKLVGKVTDKNTGEPLIGANILLQNTNLGAATDENGEFIIINIPPGVYTVKVGEKEFENIKIVLDSACFGLYWIVQILS